MPHVFFTLCVIRVTEHGGCDCDVWFYYLCDSGCSVSSVRSVSMDVIVTCGYTLCLTQVAECGVDVIFTCGFTLCVIQVTECGVDVIVTSGFTLCVIQVTEHGMDVIVTCDSGHSMVWM